MEFSQKKIFLLPFVVLYLFLLYLSFVFINDSLHVINASRKISSRDFVYDNDSASKIVDNFTPRSLEVHEVVPLKKQLENPLTVVKAVYVTGWSAGNKSYLRYLETLFKDTQINAVVVDIKDSAGIVTYATEAQKAKDYKSYYPEIPDINSLIDILHQEGVYVIGRMVVFEDPILAKQRPDLAIYDASEPGNGLQPIPWKDNRGLSWVDPASEEVWDYNTEIAKDAIDRGFDEINFDYVRFPSDGDVNTMGFPLWDQKIPRYMVIKNFFRKLRESLPEAKISVDLFGQTTTNTDDMGIGQVFEDSFEYVDYVCPMVYPSHYVNGFLGFANPADYPYEVIKNALDNARVRREAYSKSNDTVMPAKIRPWLQDFTLGAVYDAPMVSREIKAVTDSMGEDFNGFLLWNPSNIYTKEAVTLESVAPK